MVTPSALPCPACRAPELTRHQPIREPAFGAWVPCPYAGVVYRLRWPSGRTRDADVRQVRADLVRQGLNVAALGHLDAGRVVRSASGVVVWRVPADHDRGELAA